MVSRLRNLLISTLLAAISLGTTIGYLIYTQHAFAKVGYVNFVAVYRVVFGVSAMSTIGGLLFAAKQLRSGFTETERALAFLPMLVHVVLAMLLAFALVGFDVVAP